MGQVQFQPGKIIQDYSPVFGVCQVIIIIKARNAPVFAVCGDWYSAIHAIFINGIEPSVIRDKPHDRIDLYPVKCSFAAPFGDFTG